MDFHASIVRSEGLRAFLKEHREALLQYYLDIYRAHREVPVGSVNAHGIKHGPFSLGLNANSHELIRQILAACATEMKDYEFYTPELFFGLGKPVRPHNDVSLFLRAGQEVPVQLWVLLESCVLTPEGVGEVEHRNALEVGVPAASGPVYAGTSYALTPAGRIPLQFEQIIGGDTLENGDALLFKNGCVHFTRSVRQKGLFRVALALRAIRRERQEDSNYLRWMKHVWATDTALSEEAQGTYISSAQRMLLDTVDEQAADPARLVKVDNNDYAALIASMERLNPAVAAPHAINYIELRTAKSLAR